MSSNSSNDDFKFPVNKKMKLEELQKQAYYDVLHAFNAESPAMSNQRILIMRDLMKEWNITHKTHIAIDDKIKADPLVKQLRKDQKVTAAKERKFPAAKERKFTAAKERKFTAVEGKPLTLRLKASKEDILRFKEKDIAPSKIQEDKGEPSSTPDDSPIPSWGQVSPESLVRKWVSIRMPGEDSYTAFLVNQYDAQTEMHHLVTARSPLDFVDPCDWVDLRHIPTEDTIWLEGHPGFPTRKCLLKPGETILHATSTAPGNKQN